MNKAEAAVIYASDKNSAKVSEEKHCNLRKFYEEPLLEKSFFLKVS